MLKILYGSFKINKRRDYFLLPMKILYLIYTFPFLLFVFLLYIRSLGGFGNPLKEEFGLTKKVLLHFSAIVVSFGLWIGITSILEKEFNIVVRLHFLNLQKT